MNEPETQYRLTARRRREICVHEAAHAVVHAIGGATVYAVEVAPKGATDWVAEGRKGGILTDLWGCCQTSDAPGWMFIRWDEDGYCGNRKGYTNLLHKLDSHYRGSSKAQRRQLRAYICGTLAGPIADAIREGQPEGSIYLEPEWERYEDLTVAEALCWLLPFRKEFDRLATETERILREPETWRAVLRLANALESAGRIEYDGLQHYLPCYRQHWPRGRAEFGSIAPTRGTP